MGAQCGVLAGRWWCVVNAADRVFRWSTALAVLGIAAFAAVVSYEHASDLVREHGESGWAGRLILLTLGLRLVAVELGLVDEVDVEAEGPGDLV